MKECVRQSGKICKQAGFTLIEMLIVIIILGILAMVIIPQITVSTEDAKVSTLKTNLNSLRGAIEVYYAQHNMVYPGVYETDGSKNAAADPAAAFIAQLTQFTDVNGKVSGTKNDTATPPIIYGPYIKGNALPSNPFIAIAANANQVSTAITADVTAARAVLGGGANGWAYWPAVGILFANDGLSTNGVAHTTY